MYIEIKSHLFIFCYFILFHIKCSLRKCSTEQLWVDNKLAEALVLHSSCSRRSGHGHLCEHRCQGAGSTESIADFASPLLATELGKLGFSHHPTSSGPSSLAHMFSPFPWVLIIYLKTLLRKETQCPFEISCAHCLMEFILCLIWLSAFISSTLTAEQGLSFTTWAVTKPQGGFRLLLKAEELPQGGEHGCDHPPISSTRNNFTK